MEHFTINDRRNMREAIYRFHTKYGATDNAARLLVFGQADSEIHDEYKALPSEFHSMYPLTYFGAKGTDKVVMQPLRHNRTNTRSKPSEISRR